MYLDKNCVDKHLIMTGNRAIEGALFVALHECLFSNGEFIRIAQPHSLYVLDYWVMHDLRS